MSWKFEVIYKKLNQKITKVFNDYNEAFEYLKNKYYELNGKCVIIAQYQNGKLYKVNYSSSNCQNDKDFLELMQKAAEVQNIQDEIIED